MVGSYHIIFDSSLDSFCFPLIGLVLNKVLQPKMTDLWDLKLVTNYKEELDLKIIELAKLKTKIEQENIINSITKEKPLIIQNNHKENYPGSYFFKFGNYSLYEVRSTKYEVRSTPFLRTVSTKPKAGGPSASHKDRVEG